MSGFRYEFCKGSLMKVHYPKLYNMAHLLALNVLLLPKDLTIIFIMKRHYQHRRSLFLKLPFTMLANISKQISMRVTGDLMVTYVTHFLSKILGVKT